MDSIRPFGCSTGSCTGQGVQIANVRKMVRPGSLRVISGHPAPSRGGTAACCTGSLARCFGVPALRGKRPASPDQISRGEALGQISLHEQGDKLSRNVR